MDIFADPSDPSKPREGRLRRNSETSVREKTNKLLDPDEQKKHDERRRHERRHRDKDGRRHKSKHPGHRLDVIDKLDVTSIFGTGGKLAEHRLCFQSINNLQSFTMTGPSMHAIRIETAEAIGVRRLKPFPKIRPI